MRQIADEITHTPADAIKHSEAWKNKRLYWFSVNWTISLYGQEDTLRSANPQAS